MVKDNRLYLELLERSFSRYMWLTECGKHELHTLIYSIFYKTISTRNCTPNLNFYALRFILLSTDAFIPFKIWISESVTWDGIDAIKISIHKTEWMTIAFLTRCPSCFLYENAWSRLRYGNSHQSHFIYLDCGERWIEIRNRS